MDDLMEAALWAFEFQYHRDVMNAKVHCAPVRFSPLTERLALALRGVWRVGDDWTEEMARVLHEVEP